MSSWLFFAAGGGAGVGAAGSGVGLDTAGLAGGALAAAGLGADAAARGGSLFGVGAGAGSGLAAAAGLASSSEMIRLIDARISSIEGSCAFAGCVIADSTSSVFLPGKPHTTVTNRHAILQKGTSVQQLIASNRPCERPLHHSVITP